MMETETDIITPMGMVFAGSVILIAHLALFVALYLTQPIS